MKRSILLDSGADLISYGMGERSIVEIADALNAGIAVSDITYIDGTVCKVKSLDSVYDAIVLESYDELKAEKKNYAKSFYTQYCNTDPFTAKRLVGIHIRIISMWCRIHLLSLSVSLRWTGCTAILI